jgi:uncharacterized protein
VRIENPARLKNMNKPTSAMPDRYRRLSRYLRERYGCRVHRVPLDAGVTCPTRDGALSREGCLYCDERGSAASIADRRVPVAEQLARGIEAARKRYGAEKFIAYFQAFTNTYAPPEELARVYAEGTSHPDVVGLMIGTRPDCVPEPVLDLIASFRPRLDTSVEYGLQSSCDETLARLNRGHMAAQFADAAARTAKRKIGVTAHVIIGLPGETRETVLGTARFLASLPVGGVKIHLLHVLRGSPLERLYHEGRVPLLSRDEYAGLVCDFLELLPPRVVIHRLTGEAPRGLLVAPEWALEKGAVLAAIEAELARRDSWQGKCCHQ